MNVAGSTDSATFAVLVAETSRIIALSGDLDFGSIAVGESEMRMLTISNEGNSPLAVRSISYPEGFSGGWSGSIEPEESREVTVTFSPAAPQSYGGDLSIRSSATGGANTMLVSGEGMGPSIDHDMVTVEGGTMAMILLGPRTVETFQIGRYEVTWGVWKEVREAAESLGYDIGDVGRGCADDHPVRNVNWYDVVKWCNLKSELKGLTPVYTVGGNVYRSGQSSPEQNLSANGYRLPLEEEWKFAASGGNQSQGYTYSGSDTIGDVAWYGGNSDGAACNLSNGRGTWPVGQKNANELGLYDMSGNVWEWCWDSSGSSRRIRGGSWNQPSNSSTVVSRSLIDPNGRWHIGGFRLARSIGD